MLAACVAMMIPKGNIISTPVSLLEKRCVTVSKEIIRAPYFLLSFGVTERNGFHFHLFASWERNCHRLEESMCFGSEISFWFGCAFLSSLADLLAAVWLDAGRAEHGVVVAVYLLSSLPHSRPSEEQVSFFLKAKNKSRI